ncbi:hypothetical protein D918_09220 [Trichuris suis]|nr:hypothetical protein D918_09220 [Trichuris suis]
MLESLTLELCFLLLLKIALLNGAIEIQKSSSKCRLPGHLQGVYLVQKVELNYNRSAQGVLRSLKYDDVYIGPTFISKWGDCVEALGHSYILRSRKTNGSTCFKCLTILQRTPNVVQVLTSQKDSCHKSEAIAKTNCKSLSAEFPGEGIMLWKSEDVQYQLCPINGMAELTYIMSDGFQRDPEGLKLTASNCKYGYQLDVQFEDDKAVTNDMTFKCLGKWPSAKNNGEEYFAIYDSKAGEFRCGIYLENNGISHAALSIDSSCNDLLVNSTVGYETLTVRPGKCNLGLRLIRKQDHILLEAVSCHSK